VRYAVAAALVLGGHHDADLVRWVVRGLSFGTPALREVAAQALIQLAEQSPTLELRSALPELHRLVRYHLVRRGKQSSFDLALRKIEAATAALKPLPIPAMPPPPVYPIPAHPPQPKVDALPLPARAPQEASGAAPNRPERPPR
jgi:hypothetical protein